jgi:hypothetical protein
MHPHVRRAHRTLKKYLIPHKGNKYHAHALHSHHLFLYGVLFTILKVVLIVVAVLIPAEAFVAPDVLADQGAKIIARTNEVRHEQGLPELNVSSLLVRSADAKALDMGQKEYFSHVSPEGHRLSYFLAQAGYPYEEAGENLAMGFSDADGAMNGWMKSPTHYANLVDPAFKEFGVGIEGGVYQGKPTVFVAQHFGVRHQEMIQQAPPKEQLVPATPQPEPQNPHPAPADPNAAMQIAMRPAQSATKPVVVARLERVTPIAAVPKPVSVVKPVVPPVTAPVAPAVVPVPVSEPTTPTIAAAPETVSEASPVLPYRYDTDRSYVGWKDADGNRVTLEAQAVIEGEVASAHVLVNGYDFWLQPKPDHVYVGAMTVPETSDELFHVVLPPTLKVTMKNGTSYVEAIEWQHPKVVSETPWQKYIQAKSWLSQSIPVFEIVHWFYLAALVILSLALGLSIGLELRKQHPHIMVKALVLLGMLVVYIKF